MSDEYMLNAEDRIIRTIEEHDMFHEGDQVVIGLSGGPDSLCLFDVLLSLRSRLGIELQAVHVNHMFRPGAADADQKFVEDYCESRGVTCNSFTVDCNKLAEKLDLTSEEAGRKARYDNFALVAKAVEVMGTPHDKVKIVVAHNRNDQAETVLFRLIRGTGTDGLSGMEYRYMGAAGYEILRPLLDTDRKDIIDYCDQLGMKPRMDHTNEEAVYGRNKIRLKIIPEIDKLMDSDVTEAMLRLRDTAAEDRAYMTKQTETAYKAALEFDPYSDGIRLSREALTKMDDAIRHRVILKAFKEAGLEKDVARVHLLAADGVIAGEQASAALDFPKGYTMRVAYDSVWIQYEGKGSVQQTFDQLAEKFGLAQDGGSAAGGQGKSASKLSRDSARSEEEDTVPRRPEKLAPILRARLMDMDEYRDSDAGKETWSIDQDASKHRDPREFFSRKAVFDAEKVFGVPADEIAREAEYVHQGDSSQPENTAVIMAMGMKKTISARTRREGDFINLNVGRRSLQDLLVDMKVPRHMRDDILLAAMGGEVLWIPEIPGGPYEENAGKSDMNRPFSGRSRFAEKYSVSKDTKRVLILEMLYEL